MWIIITAVVLFILFKFFSDWGSERNKVSSQGGVVVKYSGLIGMLMRDHEELKITQQNKDTVVLGVTGNTGAVAFFLTHSFGNLVVQWKTKSIFFGEHKLEWSFSENMEQATMYRKIGEGLEKYHTDVLGLSGDDLNNL